MTYSPWSVFETTVIFYSARRLQTHFWNNSQPAYLESNSNPKSFLEGLSLNLNLPLQHQVMTYTITLTGSLHYALGINVP